MRARSVLSSARIRFISIKSFLRAAILTATLGSVDKLESAVRAFRIHGIGKRSRGLSVTARSLGSLISRDWDGSLSDAHASIERILIQCQPVVLTVAGHKVH